MKIPKKIEKLLFRRALYIEKYRDADIEIYEWLKKHDIEVSDDDILGGAVSICEPYVSIRSIMKKIEEA